jgi:DNA-binding Lrp family transcriptional regulator
MENVPMHELLNILKTNALETPENIAKMLGSTPAKVKAAIQSLEKKGVIRGYQAVVDEDRLDLDQVTAVIEVKVSPEREGGFDRVASRVSRFEEVQSAYLMSGAYDLLLFVSGRNLKEVARFVSEKLSTLDGVLSTSTHFMLKTYKRNGVLMETSDEIERLQVSP